MMMINRHEWSSLTQTPRKQKKSRVTVRHGQKIGKVVKACIQASTHRSSEDFVAIDIGQAQIPTLFSHCISTAFYRIGKGT